MNYIIIITELGYESLFELRETESARTHSDSDPSRAHFHVILKFLTKLVHFKAKHMLKHEFRRQARNSHSQT